MGVIRNHPSPKFNLEDPEVFDGNELDDSLHIEHSDDDDLSISIESITEQVQLPSQRYRRHRDLQSSFSRKNISGRKRTRRLENAKQLMTLVEDEELDEVDIEDFLPFRSSVFSQIVKNEVWNNFILGSENHSIDLTSCQNIKTSIKKSLPENITSLTPEQAFQSIKNGLRTTLKKKHVPVGIIEMLESGLTNHFNDHPKEPYFALSLSCYERLLLHAISQYYRLISNSINDKNQERIVTVLNPHDQFPLPNGRLSEYLSIKINNKLKH